MWLVQEWKRDKIRIGCLTPAFWEAYKWAEMLHHPCILVGDPQRRGQNQSKKKQKKNKNFPSVSLILPRVLQIAPKAFQWQRQCFTH